MDEQDIRKIIREELDAYATANNFGTSKIPFHTHNGTDSPKISSESFSLPSETLFNIGRSIYTSLITNKDQSNEVNYSFQALGKDSGKLSTGRSQSTENSVLLLQHNPRPNNTDNSTFYYGYRPPAFQTVGGISITSGTNTLTDSKASWKTNELAGASILLLDSTNAHKETKQIVSNTATVITVDSNFTFTDSNSTYITLIPIYLGAAQYPWRRGYFAEENGKNIRLGRGTSGGSNIAWICSGVGSPEGAVTAQPGSIYLNYSGGANTSLYVKESGTGNTGWIAK